jgi:hypothetical protein
MFDGARQDRAWYHGEASPRSHFLNQKWDRDPSTASRLEYGPGIYFTSDLGEATRYGAHVFQTHLTPRFNLVPRKRPSLRILAEFYKLATDDDRETFLSNWPGLTPHQALSRYAGAKTLYDAFLNLYIDLFRDPDSWVAALRELGYDGIILHLHDREPPRKYLLVWSPEKLDIEPLY